MQSMGVKYGYPPVAGNYHAQKGTEESPSCSVLGTWDKTMGKLYWTTVTAIKDISREKGNGFDDELIEIIERRLTFYIQLYENIFNSVQDINYCLKTYFFKYL